ncbi:CDP-glycerol glycerophosphotransferase family protein [Gluconobacter morbifer]|uniref:Glycerophosphotransferase n=1 Tax=Gluconobacter morbifer G707 TaxID=1088869 RepID=G6XJ40_9PROT|nr:CDP-glycerol glycerophosphotransferase family protein [Gluconobacter morbifer]EHH68156.1 hypothetical protein GMO_15060 [Gluconobacter morbifer G707]
MNIAFIYIAEPYQCYHTASVASALSHIPGFTVTEYYSFSETVAHLSRIRQALHEPPLPLRQFSKSPKARLLSRLKRLDQERELVLQENIPELNRYDAIVATEYTAGLLKKMGLSGPELILLMHGAGDRYVNDEHLVRDFDLTLLPGPKVEQYFRENGLLREGHYSVVGYPKFDVFDALGKNPTPLFSDKRPFVLYNPHYQRKLTSYRACTKEITRGFRQQDTWNLVIAPHIKMFHKGFGLRSHFLKRQAKSGIFVDTGSSAMLDMTYTSQAAIYVGDVSSQVYEFLAIPRPCVFLNPRKLPWRDNPHFLHWTLGDVVEDPKDIMDAITRAPERHAHYRPLQEKLFRETFGAPLFGASQRAADAIGNYLQRDRPAKA